MHTKRDKSIKIILAVLKFSVLILITVGVPLLIYLRYPETLEHFRSLEDINSLLETYHTASIFIYIGLQIVQVLIAFLPGQAIQFVAGYAFSVPFGLLLSLVGVVIGTFGSFHLGRLFGKDLVYLVFGYERLEKFVKLLNSKKAFIAVSLLYLFPGLPKDVFTYAAGISEMKAVPFVFTSVIARTPALLMTILVGNMFRSGSYVGIIIVSVIVATIAVISAIKRKRVYAFIDRIYHKYIEKESTSDASSDMDNSAKNSRNDDSDDSTD